MSITVNIYYTGENGNARKFAEEMIQSGTVDKIRRRKAISVTPISSRLTIPKRYS